MCLPVQPYKVERQWEHAGLQCAVVQAREASHRCGYVRVPPNHPLFGKHYDDVAVEVHGGLTFAEVEPCTEHADGQGWWFGFDCVHAGDSMYDPDIAIGDIEDSGMRKCVEFHRDPQWKFHDREHYWEREEVEKEAESLARQLAEVA